MASARLQAPIPVLRVFDGALARSFYLDWLGFSLDWEHRFEPDAPLYMQVSRGAALLHLSEHYGDASPGARMLIHVDDIDALFAELQSRTNRNMRPQIEEAPWDARILNVIDPFGNRLCFNQDNRAA